LRRLALSLFACGTLCACSGGDAGIPTGAIGSGGSANAGGSGGGSSVAASGPGGSSTTGVGSTTGSGGSSGEGGGAGSGGVGETDASFADAAADVETADAGTADAGMVSIFDGTTLKGWDGDPKIWSVKDGAIDGLTQNGGQLIVTVDDYDNFRIVGTARMPQSDNHLGVCFWGGRGGHGYNGCIDFVPPSGSIWDYGGLNGIRTYPYVWMGVPVKKTDWHQFEILANLTTGVVRMGVDGHEFPVYKDTRLDRRKKGPIGLQIHAGFSEVQYKDLAVQVNPTVDKLLTTMGPPTEPK
jgi:hypothetical protein